MKKKNRRIFLQSCYWCAKICVTSSIWKLLLKYDEASALDSTWNDSKLVTYPVTAYFSEKKTWLCIYSLICKKKYRNIWGILNMLQTEFFNESWHQTVEALIVKISQSFSNWVAYCVTRHIDQGEKYTLRSTQLNFTNKSYFPLYTAYEHQTPEYFFVH